MADAKLKKKQNVSHKEIIKTQTQMLICEASCEASPTCPVATFVWPQEELSLVAGLSGP